jgi:hypothetical protein
MRHNQLDLHGVPHEDVKWEVIRFFELFWNSDQEIEIITGNSPPMRDIVKEVCKEYNLTYRIGSVDSSCHASMRVQM